MNREVSFSVGPSSITVKPKIIKRGRNVVTLGKQIRSKLMRILAENKTNEENLAKDKNILRHAIALILTGNTWKSKTDATLKLEVLEHLIDNGVFLEGKTEVEVRAILTKVSVQISLERLPRPVDSHDWEKIEDIKEKIGMKFPSFSLDKAKIEGSEVRPRQTRRKLRQRVWDRLSSFLLSTIGSRH